MKYFVYCRKSTESEERQVLSLEAQLAELQEFAAKEKLEIVASFQEAKTAKEPGRTVFAEMMSRIEKNEANGILAWHPDRLARNSIDGGQLVYLLDTGNLCDLKFPTFWFENTPQGKFMLNIAFGQSKYYVDNLSENIKRGNRQKLRKGLWPAFAPLGYLNNRKTRGIDPDPAKARMVRKAFELYATGDYTLKALANVLTKAGLRSYKDNVLSVSSVQRMLQNPIYYGAIRFNGEAYQGVHEPIISKTTFDRVKQVMSNRGKKKRKRQHDYAFTGFMQCGNCDCAVTAEKQKGHVYYRCTKKRGVCDEKYLREELLAEQLQDMVQRVILPQNWADNMLAELDKEEASEQATMSPELTKLQNEKGGTDAKLNRLLDLQLEGGLSLEEYKQKKGELVDRSIDLDQKITKLERSGNNRLEPMREFIKTSSQAKNSVDLENNQEIVSFLKNIGSNFLLKGKTVRFEAKIGWRVLAKSRGFRNWRREGDSNPRDPRGLHDFESCAFDHSAIPPTTIVTGCFSPFLILLY